jgi:hypothetical protein
MCLFSPGLSVLCAVKCSEKQTSRFISHVICIIEVWPVRQCGYCVDATYCNMKECHCCPLQFYVNNVILTVKISYYPKQP